jgi:hypothetical protein
MNSSLNIVCVFDKEEYDVLSSGTHERNLYKILNKKIPGKRSLQGPNCGWKLSTEIDFGWIRSGTYSTG